MSDDSVSERAFLRALGSEVRAWRERRGLSREELAVAAGISASTLGRIERGDPSSKAGMGDTLRPARVLRVDFVGDLVRRAEEVAQKISDEEPETERRGRRRA
ncbi:MAG: helix-turn-helix domain-containing protein [Sciscionella sp.]